MRLFGDVLFLDGTGQFEAGRCVDGSLVLGRIARLMLAVNWTLLWLRFKRETSSD
jgi:hypothetical protein